MMSPDDQLSLLLGRPERRFGPHAARLVDQLVKSFIVTAWRMRVEALGWQSGGIWGLAPAVAALNQRKGTRQNPAHYC
jgi:hypothetical protein